MDFKFKLDKKPQPGAVKSEPQPFSDRKIVLKASDVRAPGPKPTTPHRKSDWSEKTASAWREHTSFLDQTRSTGITPPPRFGTVTNIKRRGKKKSASGTVLKSLVLIALVGGYGYYRFRSSKGFGELASETAVATTKKIASNPTQNKKASAPAAEAKSQATAVTADASAGPAATSEANPTANPTGKSAAPTSELKNQAVASAEKSLPTQPKSLRPLIRLSTQPNTPSQRPAIPRDLALLSLDSDEISNLRKNAGRNPATRAMLDAWRGELLLKRSAPGSPLKTFSGLTMKDPEYLQAKIDLQQIRELTMVTVVFGEPELAKLLRARTLAWARTYVPVGDAVSDAELEPVIEAIASVQGTLPPDERGLFDNWMLLLADRQVTELLDHEKTNDIYFAKHLMMMSLIGFTTGNKNIQNYVLANFSSHISTALLADGSSTTYQATHSIEKHAEHLRAILRVSILLLRAHITDRDVLPNLGSTFAKAIDFTYPYILGKMDHREFYGSKGYQEPEHLLVPAVTLRFLDTLIYFRPGLTPDVAVIAGQPHRASWDPSSLYFNSMIRKTDDFEQPLLTPTNYRRPSTAVKTVMRASKPVRSLER